MRRLVRSCLFVPGDRPKAIEKALVLCPDVIIMDLEDSVNPNEKAQARQNICEILNRLDNQNVKIKSTITVRINSPQLSTWGYDDMNAIMQHNIDCLVIPKVDNESVVSTVSSYINHLSSPSRLPSIWAVIESPNGVVNAAAIAQHSCIEALVLGTNDLSKDLRTRYVADRSPLQLSMSTCVLAARCHGKLAIDGVFMNIKDGMGLREEAYQGRDFGFDGKSIIHPGQIDITNEVFSPSSEEIVQAHRVIAAFDEATALGKAVAVLDGRLIENLHVVQAQAVLDMNSQILCTFNKRD